MSGCTSDPVVRAYQRWAALVQRHNSLDEDTPENIAERERLCGAWVEEVRRAAVFYAASLEGVAAKLRLLRHELSAGKASDNRDDRLLASAIDDLDRMAAAKWADR